MLRSMRTIRADRTVSGAPARSAGRAELLREVGDHVTALLEAVSRAHIPALLTADVTMQQSKMLHLVCVEPGIGVKGLANRLGLSPSSVSGAVERLVEMGLLDRHEDPTDRRHLGITLSARGREVLDRLRELNMRTFQELLTHLDDGELRGLRIGIPGMTRALDELEPRRRSTHSDEGAP
jgi:DNA-binding MarR family transcriptional regulator